MADEVRDFESLFLQLTGRVAYPWQRDLYRDLMLGKETWPRVITAPTGAGKTSLMPIWLIALAQQAAGLGQPLLPRRLVWVVNRRVVVDQATDEAERLAKAVQECPFVLGALAKMGGLVDSTDVLAVSTLRGEKADNREWSKNPARAAIIVGTVDMVGSRLLFRGYGDGVSKRPHHAGLLGQDSLIINDEAHLTVAFQKLLVNLKSFHRKKIKPWHCIFLSATLPDGANRYPASFAQDSVESEQFRKRFRAVKDLKLHEVEDGKSQKSKLLDLALEPGAQRTIVFLKRPREVADFVEQLLKLKVAAQRIVSITGTQRGFERDQLAKESIAFGVFRHADEVTEPHFLIATSAGEVGIDVSCSRLITTLDTADHLIQRFGRLNRFGEASEAVAHVVYVPPKDTDKEENLRLALQFLVALDGSVRADTLFAFPTNKIPLPKPTKLAKVTEWEMERWAMTSITGPAGVIPPVEPYLHGSELELPRTALAWRDDVDLLVRQDVDPEMRNEALRAHRILAKEKLEAPTPEVIEYLNFLNGKAGLEAGTRKVLRLDRDGTATVVKFAKLCEERYVGQLRYATFVLPKELCLLREGMLIEKGEGVPQHADVADREQLADDLRARFLVVGTEDGYRLDRIGSEEGGADAADYADWLKTKGWKIAVDVDVSKARANINPDTEITEERVIYVKKLGKKQNPVAVELGEHLDRVGKKAQEFAVLLGLSEYSDGCLSAGLNHDLGKKSAIWKRAMGVKESQELAKTAKLGNPMELRGYRHEMGSLVRAKDLPVLDQHLIATHHGRARPHFEPKARDPEADNESRIAGEICPKRFAKLQKEFGVYELAYLESLLRAADWICSAEEQLDHA